MINRDEGEAYDISPIKIWLTEILNIFGIPVEMGALT